MADNDNVIIDENGESVTIKDDSGKPAVFHFFEETYIPLDDEDGVTTEFECIASMEYEGVIYYALLPKPENEDDEPEEFVVLKGEEDGDELLFSSIDSEEENQRIGEKWTAEKTIFYSNTSEYSVDTIKADLLPCSCGYVVMNPNMF